MNMSERSNYKTLYFGRWLFLWIVTHLFHFVFFFGTASSWVYLLPCSIYSLSAIGTFIYFIIKDEDYYKFFYTNFDKRIKYRRRINEGCIQQVRLSPINQNTHLQQCVIIFLTKCNDLNQYNLIDNIDGYKIHSRYKIDHSKNEQIEYSFDEEIKINATIFGEEKFEIKFKIIKKNIDTQEEIKIIDMKNGCRPWDKISRTLCKRFKEFQKQKACRDAQSDARERCKKMNQILWGNVTGNLGFGSINENNIQIRS